MREDTIQKSEGKQPYFVVNTTWTSWKESSKSSEQKSREGDLLSSFPAREHSRSRLQWRREKRVLREQWSLTEEGEKRDKHKWEGRERERKAWVRTHSTIYLRPLSEHLPFLLSLSLFYLLSLFASSLSRSSLSRFLSSSLLPRPFALLPFLSDPVWSLLKLSQSIFASCFNNRLAREMRESNERRSLRRRY